MSNLSNNSVETVNAATTAIVTAESRVQPTSVQDKDGLKNFRVYMDDKFERLFKIYADKVKLDMQNLAFCFDGDKISSTATHVDLGMEDNDIIEVHVKSS